MREVLKIRDADVFQLWEFTSAYFKPKTSYQGVDSKMERECIKMKNKNLDL